MADAVTVSNLPDGMDLYAAYVNGRYANLAQVKARFPGKTVIAITVMASANIGDCLDVENGDAIPGDAPGWVRRRRLQGHDGPLVYCSESAWSSVKGAFAAARTDQPGYWVAGYPGAEGDAIPVGTVGHQWIDHNGQWDESIMVDYLPGIDPAPTTQEEEMPLYTTINGTGYVIAADLSSKRGIPDAADAQQLLATNLYHQVTLDATLVDAIPGS